MYYLLNGFIIIYNEDDFTQRRQMLRMGTRREEIAALLEKSESPLTAQDLCDMLDIGSREDVYEDIEHIAKTVRAQGKRVLIKPSRCGKCGHVFANRTIAKRPSKCPKCKSEWISLPGYLIRNRK